jgi:signal transduction histidine kinase
MYRPLRQLTTDAKAMASLGEIGQLADPHDPDFSPLVHELNALLQRIAAEVERQERLVTDVAHDLRTPLTVIRGRLETTLMRARTEEYRPAMETAVRETERLSAMADAILRSQEEPVDAAAIELSTFVAEAIDRWTPIFEQRDARLAGTYVECWARVTSEEWTSLLDNLLDNAFKYGGDYCSVALTCGSEIRLEVCDNGGGVPEAERERVFERFVRLDSSRGADGHGLGLYLCATTVRARGGTIGLAPKQSGICILIELPKAAPTK